MMAIYPAVNPLQLDVPLNIGVDAGGLRLGPGWSVPEGEFRWTDGSWAELEFSYRAIPFSLDLVVDCQPFVSGTIPAQRVLAFLDGRLVHIASLRERTAMRLPVKEASPSDGGVKLVLFLPDARRSDADDGIVDFRQLGLQVWSVRLVRASAAEAVSAEAATPDP